MKKLLVDVQDKTYNFIQDCAFATNITKGEVVDDIVNDYVSSHIHMKFPENDKPIEFISQDTLWPPTGGIKFKYTVTSMPISSSFNLVNNLEKLLNDINKNDSLELYDIINTNNSIIVIHKEYQQ